MTDDATEQFILDEEGYRARVYRCTSGALTIGIGYNLDAGMPIDEAMLLMRHRVGTITQSLQGKFAWFDGLNEARRAVLVSMAYQMGLRGLYGFRRMLAAIEAGEYEAAGREMLDSTWARQTPARARRTAEMMRLGQFVTGR